MYIHVRCTGYTSLYSGDAHSLCSIAVKANSIFSPDMIKWAVPESSIGPVTLRKYSER